MDARLQTLALAAAAAAGASSGYLLHGSDFQLSDSDRAIIYRGSTAAVHAMSFRRAPRSDAGVTLSVYGTVQTDDGGVRDLGETNCAMDDSLQAALAALAADPRVVACAAGDGGAEGLEVHAVDLRRRVSADGGQEGAMEAYGNFLGLGPANSPIYLPGHACPFGAEGLALFDSYGLACFRRGQGLGK